MQIVYNQDLLKTKDDYDFIGIPTNSVILTNGCLCMGAGFAAQCLAAYPSIDWEAAQAIVHRREYGAIWLPSHSHYKEFFLFQTKRHFSEKSDLSLITKSTKTLNAWARIRPEMRFAMPYPGIGCGGLARDKVEEIVCKLPENVTLFIKE